MAIEYGSLIICKKCGFKFFYTSNNKGVCLKCGGDCVIAKS